MTEIIYQNIEYLLLSNLLQQPIIVKSLGVITNKNAVKPDHFLVGFLDIKILYESMKTPKPLIAVRVF